MDVLAARGDRSQNESIKMGLLAVPNSHTSSPVGISEPRTRKGLQGIGSNARRCIRSAVKLMEKLYGVGRLAFATFTLPVLFEIDLLTISKGFSSVMKTVKTTLQRHLKARGMPEEMIMVAEVQKGRYEKYGQVCLHIHAVFVNSEGAGCVWAIQRDEMTSIWETVLSNKLNRPVSAPNACQLVQCRKSVANELGKYLSKGGSIIEDIKRAGKADFLPQSWYSITKGLRELVKATTEKHQNECVNLFVDNLQLFNVNNLTDIKPIYRQIPDDSRFGKFITICVGYSGHIKDDFASKFRQLLGSKTEMLDFIGILSLKNPITTLKTA
jgi:hypothetical protein